MRKCRNMTKNDRRTFFNNDVNCLCNLIKNFHIHLSDISEEECEITQHCRESYLFHDGNPWIKRGNDNFDVTMGSFDGAELCDTIRPSPEA